MSSFKLNILLLINI